MSLSQNILDPVPGTRFWLASLPKYPIPFLRFISKLPLKASTPSRKMSPTPDPNLGRRQKMTPYSTLGRRFGGVFSKFSERLQIGCLLVG